MHTRHPTRKWNYQPGISDRPMCERFGWVPYGKEGWNGSSRGSNWEPCRNPAEYKDAGQFVCNKHRKKKNTPLLVEIDYGGFNRQDGLIEVAQVLIHKTAGVLPE